MEKKEIITIGNKEYIIETTEFVEVQNKLEDVNVYGWILEVKHKDQDTWFRYWTNKIYYSRLSATEAALKINFDQRYRIVPLYRMDNSMYRNYKINKILSTHSEPEHEIKYWKVKKDFNIDYYKFRPDEFKEGDIIAHITKYGVINIATPKRKTVYNLYYIIKKNLIPKGYVEEVNIEDEYKSHPHLIKKLKQNLKNEN